MNCKKFLTNKTLFLQELKTSLKCIYCFKMNRFVNLKKYNFFIKRTGLITFLDLTQRKSRKILSFQQNKGLTDIS